MTNSNRFFTELLLSLFALLQISLQFVGVYYLNQHLQACDTLCKSLSISMIEYMIGFDLTQLGAMLFLFFGKSDLVWLSVPIAMLFYQVFWHSIGILHTINPIEEGQEGEEVGFRKSLTHYNTCLLKGLCTFFLFYLNNMHSYLFIVFFALYLFPQIH